MISNDDRAKLSAWLFRQPRRTEPKGPSTVYMLLDAARDRRIYRALQETVLEHRCLFTGKLHPALQAASPYLVELHPEATLFRFVLEKGWGNAWGTFVISSAGMEELRRHFRRFLRVVDENGKKLFFRFYDPRVLRLYLPTCTEIERVTVYGPVTRFVLEGEDPSEMLELSLQQRALVPRSIDWMTQSPSSPEPPSRSVTTRP